MPLPFTFLLCVYWLPGIWWLAAMCGARD